MTVKFIGLIFLSFLIGCSFRASALQQRQWAEISGPARSYKYNIGSDHRSIVYAKDEKIYTCKVKTLINELKISFDKSAIIISANSYIPISKIESCDDTTIIPDYVSKESGILVDVNINKNVYISLVLVSTQPFSYLAVVSSIGNKERPLIDLPGSYTTGDSRREQLQRAFTYSDDDEYSAKISPDGRYVTVNGAIDCSQDAYPGVWDLRKREKVIIPNSINLDDKECKLLFGIVDG